MEFIFPILFKSYVYSELHILDFFRFNIEPINIISDMKRSFVFIPDIKSFFSGVHYRGIMINIVFGKKIHMLKTQDNIKIQKKKNMVSVVYYTSRL